jgi:hypothetical protein
MNQRGVVLIAVLWVVTMLSGLVAAGFTGVRLSQLASWNRMVLLRSRWAADACAAIAEGRWARGQRTDSSVIDLGRGVRCSWRISDPAARLNVNTVPLDCMARLLRELRVHPDSAREFMRVLSLLRTGTQIWDVRAVADLSGFNDRLLPHITVAGLGTVNVAAAAPEVLGALPGMTREAVQVLVSRRSGRRPIGSIHQLSAELSEAAGERLERNRRELTRLVRFEPDRLLMVSSGWIETDGTEAGVEIEWLLAPLPDRFAVLWRRLL